MQKETFYKIIEIPTLLNRQTLSELRNLTENYPFFQAAWMLYLKNLKETGDPGFEIDLKKAAIALPDRKQLYRFLNSKNENYGSNYYFEKKGTVPIGFSSGAKEQYQPGSSLIDKFLSASPGRINIGKPSQEDHSENRDNDIVTKSATESDEIVTETLALIYLEQNKYDKALEAFKKLSLKYPEKSIYFATRIKEIEKLKNI